MKETVAIIGGGIAGMEAARQLYGLGYTPVIIEKSDRTGGHVNQWHKLFPDMKPAHQIIDNLTENISNLKVYLNTSIASVNKLKDGYNIVLNNGVLLSCRAVLFATGFSLFKAEKKEEYGYKIYNQVITSSDLEQWFNHKGIPAIDSRSINKIGFVHCVGSRDIKAGNSQCSKVCCITAIKQAMEMKEHFPDAQIYCFYMDLRLFGKKYEDFYIKAQQEYGIHFIRGRVSEVSETIDGGVLVKAEDTLSGKPVKITLDLLVLMTGMVCNTEISGIASELKIATDSDGFLKSRNNIDAVTCSERDGIFFAGACTGTKTIPETLSEAKAAALDIHNYLRSKK